MTGDEARRAAMETARALAAGDETALYRATQSWALTVATTYQGDPETVIAELLADVNQVLLETVGGWAAALEALGRALQDADPTVDPAALIQALIDQEWPPLRPI